MTVLKFKTQPADRGFAHLAPGYFPLHSRVAKSQPPVNIYTSPEGYMIELIAPGFNKEDLVVSFEKNLLTIESKGNVKADVKNGQLTRNEYQIENFRRSFNVDEEVDGEGISAEYVNGILRLNLPKKQPVKTPVKQITIL